MSRPVITVEGLSKEYVIGGRESAGETFREMVVSAAVAPFRRLKRLRGEAVTEERIWALKDVSFEVKEGEVVGVIGRNGAGKSTLLKILSRITAPTTGRVEIRGRVASLLEVGTGFHPELTGRENIYLNGAILGMSRAEIDRKFDEIVDFSGVEKFLDTPVKRYSSGMSIRLAFAVAAYLEPEILIVDEVLAVGDAEFQKKCLGKMNDVSRLDGRTVLFVSHNMDTIMKLCERCILLEKGKIRQDADTRSTISNYLSERLPRLRAIDLCNRPRIGMLRNSCRLNRIESLNRYGFWSFPFGEKVLFDVWIEAQQPMEDVELGIGIFSERGFEVASWTGTCAGISLSMKKGINGVHVDFQKTALLPGQYSLGIGLRSQRGFEDYISDAASFEITTSNRSAEIMAHTFGGVIVPEIGISKISDRVF